MIDAGHIIEALLLAVVLWMRWRVKKDFKKELAAEVVALEGRLLEKLRDEYVQLDYPNAKPLHDIHARLDVFFESQTKKEGHDG